MTIICLSLVLKEYPSESDAHTNYHWSSSRSIHSLKFFDGMVEVTFSDGDVRVFNQEAITKMFDDCSPFLRNVLSMIESRDNN